MAMKLFDRVTTLVKADAHGVVANGFSDTTWIPLRAAAMDASEFR